MVPFAILIAGALGWLLYRSRRNRLPARTLIISPPKSTVIAGDGAVRSLQSAKIEMPAEQLQRLWTPPNLENLGRTYWLFLTKATFGIVRVRYSEDERAASILGTPLALLRFAAPEYELEADRAKASWQIKNGLLVAKSGRGCGHLSLEVTRNSDTEITVEVEVANFYPAIAVWFSTLAYEATQAFVHVLVTHAFLRSLATLELAESHVGTLRTADEPSALDRP
jgi:hypothetical protein